MSDAETTISRGLRLIVFTAALIIAAAGIRALGDLISSAFLALVLVVVVFPVRGRLQRGGAPRWIVAASVPVVAYSILAVIFASIAAAAVALVNHVKSEDYREQLADLRSDASSWLVNLGVEGDELDDTLDSFDVASLAGRLVDNASGLFGLLTVVAVSVMLVIFMTQDSSVLLDRLEASREDRPAVVDALEGFATDTRRFFVVNTIFGLIVAGIDTLLLLAIGVPLALIWGLLSFMSSFIPNVGFVVGLIPPMLLALVELGVAEAVIIMVFYIVVNLVVDSVLKPRFVGDAVSLGTSVTFLSLLFWSWMFGAVGALLAVPMTLFVRALLMDSDPDAQWFRGLISGKP